MEATLSRLPSVPKERIRAKQSLETDGGDSSSDDDIYEENDTYEERQAKLLYTEVRKQATKDVRKKNKYAIDKIRSNVSKFSLGKKMCIFVYKSGVTKGERCPRERSGNHGKYCSADHLRQVKRRGQRRKKNNVNVLPAGRDKLYIDNKGVAHTQTSDVDEVEAKFTKLFGKRPQLLGPVPAPSAPSTQGDAPAPHVAARVDNIEEIELDDADYARIADLATSKPVIAEPTVKPATNNDDVIAMELDDLVNCSYKELYGNKNPDELTEEDKTRAVEKMSQTNSAPPA